MAEETNGVCKGCGATAEPKQVIEDGKVVTQPGQHPWIGVGAPDLGHATAEDDDNTSPQDFVAFEVCDACHKDPAHRTKNALKVHFFPAAAKKIALVNAREQTMVQDPTPAQAAKNKQYLVEKAKSAKAD